MKHHLVPVVSTPMPYSMCFGTLIFSTLLSVYFLHIVRMVVFCNQNVVGERNPNVEDSIANAGRGSVDENVGRYPASSRLMDLGFSKRRVLYSCGVMTRGPISGVHICTLDALTCEVEVTWELNVKGKLAVGVSMRACSGWEFCR